MGLNTSANRLSLAETLRKLAQTELGWTVVFFFFFFFGGGGGGGVAGREGDCPKTMVF